MRLRVAGVAHEADHGSGLDLVPVDGERREGGEVGVVELVPLPVAQPEPVAAAVVPADREDGAVGDREQRRSERREDVLAVVPADARARRSERVRERRRPVDREDVAARRERRRHVGGRRPEDRAGPAGLGLGRLRQRLRPASAARRRVVPASARAWPDVVRRAAAGGDGRRRRRLGMTDEDLRTRREPAVIGGEHDAQRGHRGAGVARVRPRRETRPPARASPRSPSRRAGSARSGSRSPAGRARRGSSRCDPTVSAPVAEALARPATLSAVISPFRSEIASTSVTA